MDDESDTTEYSPDRSDNASPQSDSETVPVWVRTGTPPERPGPAIDTPALVSPLMSADVVAPPPEALEQGPLDRPINNSAPPPKQHWPVARLVGLSLITLGVIAGLILAVHGYDASKKQNNLNSSLTSPSERLKPQTTSLTALGDQLDKNTVQPSNVLTVNGQLDVNGSLVLGSSGKPGSPSSGQLYYDESTNQLGYYNGTGFVYLQGGGSSSVTNIYNSFITNAASGGVSINGPAGVLAMFGTGSGLQSSVISDNGTTASIAGSLRVAGIANASTAVYTPELDTESPGTLTIGQNDATNVDLGGVNTSTITLGVGGVTPTVPVIQGAAAVGNNIIGANMVIDAPNGTGVGGSGNINFYTAGGVSNPAVSVDAVSGNEGSQVSSLTWTHTTGANPDELLMVAVDTAATGVVPSTATSVTYNGVGLTELTSLVSPGGGLDAQANGSVWYMVDPPQGAHTVAVTLSGSNSDIGAASTTLYNVDQSDPIATYATNQVDNNQISTTLTGTNAGEGVIDALMTRASIGNEVTPGSGQTGIYGEGYFSDTNFGSFRQGEAGSTTMSWTGNGGGSIINQVVTAINPEPNLTPDTLTQALSITQSGTLGVDLATGEDAQSTISFGGSADRSIGVNQNPGTGNGHSLTISAGQGAVGNNNGGNLTLQAGAATGSGVSGAISMLSGNAANTTGAITIQSGDSSTTSAGNVTVDTGSNTVNGVQIADWDFETAGQVGDWAPTYAGFYTLTQDCTVAHSGSCSMNETGYGTGGGSDVYTEEEGTPLSFTPGHEYQFSMWVKAATAAAPLYAHIYNMAGCAAPATNDSTSQWTHLVWTCTAAPGITFGWFIFGFGSPTTETHYWDDITATDLSASSTIAALQLGATNAQTVTLGNMSELGATDIFGSSDINLASGASDISMNGYTVTVEASTNSTDTFQIQNSGGGDLLVADTSDMAIDITGNLAVSGTITVDGHIVTGGSTPAISAGSAACTSPTVGVTGDDTSGMITVTTGTGCSGNGTLATLTFANAFGTAPHISLTPDSLASLNLGVYNTGTSTTGTSIGIGSTPAASTTYSWDYQVIQ